MTFSPFVDPNQNPSPPPHSPTPAPLDRRFWTGADSFSTDYFAARSRFLQAAAHAHAEVESIAVAPKGPGGEPLSIDVACLGAPEFARAAVVVTSGLHGVEGFLGSALQSRLLEDRAKPSLPPACRRLVLIHALNPFGFSHLRRVDQDNVDLNRNFLLDGQTYSGSPRQYIELDWLLNPARPPSWLDLFVPRALGAILQHGFNDLKQAVAGGQYDYPRGLFYGGNRPSDLQPLLALLLRRLIGPAHEVMHIDIHTGLGEWANLELLLEPSVPPARVRWLVEQFGKDHVRDQSLNGIAYQVRGGLGSWFQSLFPGRGVTSVCAEFGTYSPLRVLSALREESQAHHWSKPGQPAYERAKRRLKETFAPPDRRWRDETVAQGVALVRGSFDFLEAAGARHS
jgi:hypothetical protein